MNKVKHMTTRRKVLKRESRVIDAYGGTLRTAERWGVTPAAVSEWRARGIPRGWHLRMYVDLESQGYLVDVKALGWVTPVSP